MLMLTEHWHINTTYTICNSYSMNCAVKHDFILDRLKKPANKNVIHRHKLKLEPIKHQLRIFM